MKSICIIPARFQSSRFPGKLLAIAGGKTVLQRTFEQANRCKELSAIYVATDHELIADHVEKLGGEVIWTSPECPNGTARLIEALKKRPEIQKAKFILNLQADHPCTSPQTMTAVLDLLEKSPEAAMATTASLLKDLKAFYSPHVVKCIFDLNQTALYFSRSPIPYSAQGLPKAAYHHIGLYAYRTDFLLSSFCSSLTPLQSQEDLEQLHIMEKGFAIKIALTKDPPIGVDTPEDLLALKKYLQRTRKAPQESPSSCLS